LLTVVEHELGHELGLEDSAGDGLMGIFLGTGVRRVPASVHPSAELGGTAPSVARSTGRDQIVATIARLLVQEGIGPRTRQAAPQEAAMTEPADPGMLPRQASANSDSWPQRFSTVSRAAMTHIFFTQTDKS